MSANAVPKQTKGMVMERKGDEVHLNETEAAGAVKSKGVRKVLAISLALVVLALGSVFVFGSAFH
jgi:hypothetical protein